MKIKINDHNIKEVSHVNPREIPLAHIIPDNESELFANIKLSSDFVENSVIPIRPYQKIDDPAKLIFSSAKKQINLDNIKKKDLGYTYEPDNITEFSPTTFYTYSVIKKNLRYSSVKNYNIKVSTIDPVKDDFLLCEKMMQIFGDAWKKGICPNNIKINDGSLDPRSLDSATPSTSDIVFATSVDGEKIEQYVVGDYVRNRNMNFWLGVENFENALVFNNSKTSAMSADGIFYEGLCSPFYEKTERAEAPIRVFSNITKSEIYPDANLTFLYEDVMLLTIPEKGCIVISPKELLYNAAKNAKIIYDVMMYVYLNSYHRTKKVYSWITNYPVDYFSYVNSKQSVYHNKIYLTDMINDEYYKYDEDEYNLIEVSASDEVVFVSMDNSTKEMFFRKTNIAKKDPDKDIHQVSCLTENDTVINYLEEDINYIETKINVSSFLADNKVYITLDPIYSSSKKIYVDEFVTLKVPSSHTYYLCIKPISKFGEKSQVTLILPSDYSYELNGYIAATVSMELTMNTEIYDLRVNGGGIPINEEDDYNMNDIGNMEGRPYRIGSTMIISLPKKCKPYQDIISTEVYKHITSGDYPILNFVDR